MAFIFSDNFVLLHAVKLLNETVIESNYQTLLEHSVLKTAKINQAKGIDIFLRLPTTQGIYLSYIWNYLFARKKNKGFKKWNHCLISMWVFPKLNNFFQILEHYAEDDQSTHNTALSNVKRVSPGAPSGWSEDFFQAISMRYNFVTNALSLFSLSPAAAWHNYLQPQMRKSESFISANSVSSIIFEQLLVENICKFVKSPPKKVTHQMYLGWYFETERVFYVGFQTMWQS